MSNSQLEDIDKACKLEQEVLNALQDFNKDKHNHLMCHDLVALTASSRLFALRIKDMGKTHSQTGIKKV